MVFVVLFDVGFCCWGVGFGIWVVCGGVDWWCVWGICWRIDVGFWVVIIVGLLVVGGCVVGGVCVE